MTKVGYYENDFEAQIIDALVGTNIISTTEDTLVLSNGTHLKFDKFNSSCCTSIELVNLSSSGGKILSAGIKDNEDETEGEGAYKTWIWVLTEAGELNVVEADGDAGNGYYLHGFALDVDITHILDVPVTDDEVQAAIASIRGKT